VTASRHC